MNRNLVRLIAPPLVTVLSMLLVEPITARQAVAREGQTSLLVVSANVREGSRLVRPVDNRDGDDRRAFARRLLNRGIRIPDVVLLQEAIGTAGAIARTLNAHPRAKRLRARYVVAVPTSYRWADGSCDGPRGGHRVIRDGAILVNKQTIARVLNRGLVRSWGQWMAVSGLPTYACAEQAWVMLQVRDGLPGQAQARIANVHIAPTGDVRKNRALSHAATTLASIHRKTPHAMLVVGGDFNLTRCQGDPRAPERRDCAVRVGHQQLLENGFSDAVRSTRFSAVAGVRRRIDFIYTQDRVRSSSWDRCYLAFNTTRPGCRAVDQRFPVKSVFGACQYRADRVGGPGGRCSPRMYGRYYSDHPIVRASIAWR